MSAEQHSTADSFGPATPALSPRGPGPGTLGTHSALSTQHSALLALREIEVRRAGHTILAVPSLDVWPHEVLAVLGPNGAGKSTLLQVMALLLAPDAGTVHFHSHPVAARRNPVPVRRRMAVVFQEPLLFDTSVADNVASG